ncbi:unnamed protein product [Cyclocybe aegerita]|uniref:Uncharacterized protein n=1 Tax=Cyclocybe aegerita TaxID=1973307 RepID=A0A8S0WBT8_CYCAE|nr:unnamed protein product [Cyclocybe aegerita]
MTSQSVHAKPIPVTPIRGLFCRLNVFHSVDSLDKWSRGSLVLSESLSASPVIVPSSEDIPIPSAGAPPSARVAFQLHDDPLDAVVITTLPCYPFCCHEDLLLMSRKQLMDVATIFNARLPQNIQIELSDAISDAHIRHCIERLVGIVPNVPGAPKPAKSKIMEKEGERMLKMNVDLHADALPSPPSSPLAMRASRRRGLSLMSSPPRVLESLREEEEDDVFSNRRHVKKRKVSDTQAAPTRVLYECDNSDVQSTPTPSRTRAFKGHGKGSSAPLSHGTPSLSAAQHRSKRLRLSDDLASDVKSSKINHGHPGSPVRSHKGDQGVCSVSQSSLRIASFEESISHDLDVMRMDVA